MLATLHQLIVKCSHSWQRFFLLAAAFALSLYLLMRTGAAFAALTGYETFDNQSSLTMAQIGEQLPTYNAAARALYWRFTLIDFFFPLLGGLFTATVGTFAVRNIAPTRYDRFSQHHAFLVFLTPTLFDWAENLANVFLIGRYPPLSTWAAQTMLLLKWGKLATLIVTQSTVLILLLLWFLRGIISFLFSSRTKKN